MYSVFAFALRDSPLRGGGCSLYYLNRAIGFWLHLCTLCRIGESSYPYTLRSFLRAGLGDDLGRPYLFFRTLIASLSAGSLSYHTSNDLVSKHMEVYRILSLHIFPLGRGRSAIRGSAPPSHKLQKSTWSRDGLLLELLAVVLYSFRSCLIDVAISRPYLQRMIPELSEPESIYMSL